MARYLITGGAGFIGSHLAEALVDAGQRVRVLDDLSSGRAENLPDGVELITEDVTRPHAVRQALAGVDGCFHLAAVASVEECRKHWLRSHKVNLGGTITVFEEVARAQARRGYPLPVVYASSAAIYGNPSAVPISETVPPRPENAYGVDKLAGEMHAAVSSRSHQLATVGVRFFNVYGPRQDPNSPYSGVITIFCSLLSQGLQIEIYGDGSQVRDFVYVGDAVAALQRAMAVAAPLPQVFNVCTGIGTSILELGDAIARVSDSPFRPRYRDPRIGDLRISIGDPRRAREVLGFNAAVSLHPGLERTLAAMKSCGGALATGVLTRRE
jgi:UDP-glucose 4-epimerase